MAGQESAGLTARVVLFQEGIPDLFFAELEKRGCRISRFATDSAAARDAFRQHNEAGAVFFRANFSLGQAELDVLPHLKLAALVSTGSDNIDTPALSARGVKLVTGEGANAQAVFDYVIQALLFGGFNPERHSVGVIGAGRVGSRILAFLKAAGVKTEFYDPYLTEKGSRDAAAACDFVTFHVPLTRTGEHPTHEMLAEDYFPLSAKTTRLIQTCRGGIWNREFYSSIGDFPGIEILAQDVYPAEPPPIAALRRAKFSTPHIAGYSTRGRLGGILSGIRALFPDFPGEELYPRGRAWFLHEESAAFSAQPANFAVIRDSYTWRKEFHEYDPGEAAALRAYFPQVSDKFFTALFEPLAR